MLIHIIYEQAIIQPGDCARTSVLSAKLKMTEMKLFPFLSLSLCRSGSLKARLCSTWSAASAWTVRPRRALWSSRSVAPRWPASPGSHKSSPEPQRTGGGRGRGRKREEQDLDPACRKTLGVGEGRGITSAHCLTPRRGVEGVRTVLL